MSILKLASGGKRPTDPARAALAEAITAFDEAARRRAALADAVTRAQEAAYQASDALEAATEAVETERAALTARTVNALLDGAAAPANTVVHARARVREAQDALDTARDMLAVLQAGLPDAEAAYTKAARDRDAAAGAVLAPLVERFTERVLNAHTEWLTNRQILHFLLGTQPGWPRPDEVKRAERVAAGENNFSELMRGDHAGPWREAFKTLKRDAHAALPEVV
jgi:hypothetical protein